MTHPELIERITRSLAYMLRHQPEQFDLQLDEYGWADLDEVVRALHERLGEVVSAEDVTDAVSSGDRQRYEVDSNRIRALYGHSIPVKPGEPARPPEHLYLGLSRRDADRAERNGLRPGRRQFLHLALSREDALESAQRNFEDCVLMEVQSLDAWEEGINFYDRRALFLSDPIPPHHLVRMEPRQRVEALHTDEEGESTGFEAESSEEMGSGDSERPAEGDGGSRRRGRRGRRGRGRGRDSDRDSRPQQPEAGYEEQSEPRDDRPEYRDERPAQREERPQYREDRPARRDERPQYREDRPARREERPQYREDRPAQRDERPQYREDRPARRDERPQYREDRPAQRDERPQYREDRPPQRDERPQYREDRPARREDRPQYREDRPARREERPQYREERAPRREERAPRGSASESFGEGLVEDAPVRREPARPAPAASRPTPPPPARAVEPEEDNFGAGL